MKTETGPEQLRVVPVLHTVAAVVLSVSGAGLCLWFLQMPNAQNVLDAGLGVLRERGLLEQVAFFGVPLLGFGQLALSLGLWRGWAPRWLPTAALVIAVVDVVVGLGVAVLVVRFTGLTMH